MGPRAVPANLLQQSYALFRIVEAGWCGGRMSGAFEDTELKPGEI